MSEWFSGWFNSPFYHLLYQHRNRNEACSLIKHLLEKLHLPKQAEVTDLGCGSGRHCQALFDEGMLVNGIDLSENSINEAKKNCSNQIRFYVSDMRNALPIKNQQAIFSLFTSFGYFDNTADNLKVLSNINQSLVSGGWLVIDYLNAIPLTQMPRQQHLEKREGIEFKITKFTDENFVHKIIQFDHNHQHYEFSERVSLFALPHFSNMLNETGFQIISTFGDYMMNPFDIHSSPRLIILAKKL